MNGKSESIAVIGAGSWGTALGILLARHGGDRDELRDRRAGVGDELLRAVDDPLVALEARGGASGAGVGASLRLGEAEAAHQLAGGQFGQILLLLLLRSIGLDGEHDE